jgi:hypothetical protein
MQTVETRFPEWETYGSDVTLRFRTRFHKDLIFTEMVAMPSNSLETVRAAVAAQVPKPLLPDPWPPYPVSDLLDSKRLGALKMKLSIGITGVDKLSSSELLTLIDIRFPERASVDPRTSLIISGEVLLHADGNVTYGTQVPDEGTFPERLIEIPARGTAGFIRTMLVFSLQSYIEEVT